MSQQPGARPAEQPAEPPQVPAPGCPPAADSSALQAGLLRGVLAALLAAGITGAIIQAVDPLFTIPQNLRSVEMHDPPERLEQQKQALAAAEVKNTMFVVGLLGLTLGGLLAVVEAGARGCWHRAAWTAVLGGLVAAVAGMAAAWLGWTVRQRLQVDTDFSPLTRTILVHGILLGVLALGVGAGLALPYRQGLWANALIGALLGGVLAALVYPVAVATFFPRVNTDSLLPYPTSALLGWLLTAALLIAAVATSLGQRETTARGGPADPTPTA